MNATVHAPPSLLLGALALLGACGGARAVEPAVAPVPQAACAERAEPPRSPRDDADPQDDAERSFYALGALLADRTAEYAPTPREQALIVRGMLDRWNRRPALADPGVYAARLRAIASERAAALSAETRRRGEAYVERVRQEPGAQVLDGGVVYLETRPGTGAQPAASDAVTVHYRGTLVDGSEFDSSHTRGRPATFRLTSVIRCWTTAVPRMRVGGAARLVCPPDTAYGDRAPGAIPAGSTLVFDVELLSVTPAAP